ncbi:hypothetical protein B4W74_12805 [Staphylococcus intermedius]|uniref:hypothetical protein n=1 Tax=Staphylococcus intermedius TaxID=1285 RepID=UPI000BBB7AD6|nr:hypothetical protein [Staphylococcus intermedius]PCF77665.1 hypothetical protein B4W74_12805 [Staphylococcus intermedius]
MKISNEKRVVINYVSNTDTKESKRIFDGTYGELRKIHGEDFNGFSERDAFILKDENGNEEKVGIFKMKTSHPASSDSIKDEFTVRPL